ncbi:MAG TPA: DUF4097 family beta strand repeat-containing protein [Gemmatimonadaceae bacterium]|jgi:DUF4097 and DUF4098 domain-containing protein YvlB|nr:DUF4097 family beta strand repeat protein [Gemmatimonadota bacterium]MBP9106650.1 DUF4097 family beta strand repeat protein [Gemmatimonadaceae bacterium]MBK9408181.1 DUF4097 family beta strand repeat protein [Gemmatimonadota bacterium]MBK9979909.1 DUF4097 family beta strand repeat protein [Gemmatimonadota bacterium]HNV74571.1 DUF4097 family beta strand repeat-containing protein [Gemmatimonadaceae bacterium]
MPRSPVLLALALATALPATLHAQSSERSIERMAENIAAAAERMAARVEKHATLMAERIEREIERKRKSDPNWNGDDDTRDRARRNDDVPQGRSRVDTTVAFSADGTIDLSNISGEIVVTGWSRREAQIKASSERGRLELDVSSSRITLEEEGRGSMWGGSRRGDSRYEVSVPRGVRVIARSISGDVMVRGTGGEVEAGSTSGDVQVEDAVRRIELTSVSGDVTARQLKGTVEATSVSGSVELDAVDGDLHANTTSGDITLSGITSRDVETSTTSGDITFAGDMATDGRYEFHSHSGTIELSIPGSANARFSVETFSGELESDFPITLQPGDRSSRRPRRFEFSVGNGGARIIAETFSGDLEIRKR